MRGAAALGAMVLVIAGLYSFKDSIEAGLISPTLRAILGTLVGVGGIVSSELMRRRRYTVLANWLGGAGVAILYTSFWAAHSLYALIGSAVAFALMALVTVTCGLLAMRHDTMVIALLGLSGGFATPIALSSGADHPIGLFGYLLLLDSALLYLSVKRRWPILGALSLLGTFFYQAAWIGGRMGPERLVLGMGIVVVFGALYGASLPEPRDDEGSTWPLTRAAGVLLPFGFGLYFGLRSDTGDRFLPLGLMMLLLSSGAAWMARAKRTGWVALAAAIASITVSGAWMATHDHAAAAWEVAGLVGAIALVFHGSRELDHARPSAAGPGPSTQAASASALAALLSLVIAGVAPSSRDPLPWLVGWVVIGALAVRQSFLGAPGLRLGVAALVSLGAPLVHLVHADDPGFAMALVYPGGIAVVTALAALGAFMMRRDAGAAPASQPKGLPVGHATDALVVLAPFAFALYFAARASVGPPVAPLLVLIAALSAAALWSRSGPVALAAAIAGQVVIGAWMATHEVAAVPWEAAGLAVVVAVVFHVFTERGEARGLAWIAASAAIAGTSSVVLLTAASTAGAAHVPWPFAIGAVVSAALVVRQARAEGRAAIHLAPAIALGIAIPVMHAAHAGDPAAPPAAIWLGLAVVLAAAAQGIAQRRAEGPARRWASHAAALFALILLGTAFESTAPPALVMGATLALLASALLSAARLAHGGWAMAAVIAGAFVHTAYVLGAVPEHGGDATRGAALVALAGQILAVALIGFWPVITRSLRGDAWAFRAAALGAPLWFPALHHGWTAALGRSAIGLLPLALGAIAAGAGARSRALLPGDAPVRKTALVWLFGVALASISIAIPLQLDNEWITVGWAIEGAALLVLWRRLDHAGLKYMALAHLGVVAARLVLNPAVLDYHARGWPVLNWLVYTYWIPVAALAAGWWILREQEAPRARSWEGPLYPKDQPIFAVMSAASAIVVFFVWVNLTIFDAFGERRELTLAFEHLPARDLTLSLSWAVYALILLALGMARRSAALRWTSLGLIIVTAGKAFLYDLSHLHDLYRVMSLVGLALSLILISLAYQRFVFARREG